MKTKPRVFGKWGETKSKTMKKNYVTIIDVLIVANEVVRKGEIIKENMQPKKRKNEKKTFKMLIAFFFNTLFLTLRL